MEILLDKLIQIGSEFGLKLLYALIVLVIGMRIIRLILNRLFRAKWMNERVDAGVSSFLQSFVKIMLYALLIIACCSIIGIPATSFITILASAGVAIGMALQGSLSNFAGGLMILFFKPFRVGDFIEAGGVSGVVTEIQTFYTTLTTLDNKRITLPNGTLTNAPVIDYSTEAYRRVDLVFYTAADESMSTVKELIGKAVDAVNGYERDREVFVGASCQVKGELQFTVRVWSKNENYWDVYFALNEKVHTALEEAKIKQPTAYVTMQND